LVKAGINLDALLSTILELRQQPLEDGLLVVASGFSDVGEELKLVRLRRRDVL